MNTFYLSKKTESDLYSGTNESQKSSLLENQLNLSKKSKIENVKVVCFQFFCCYLHTIENYDLNFLLNLNKNIATNNKKH